MSANSQISPFRENDFPSILQNSDERKGATEFASWIGAHRHEVELRLAECGAVLFRGFPLHTAHDFDDFVAAFGWVNFPYSESLSNAVRVNRTPRVFTANEAPSTVVIYLHHEMAQTPVYPARLFFFCEQPAETGGATPICPSYRLWDQLVQRYPEFAHKCEVRGLMYTHTMPAAADPASGLGRSWRDTLGVTKREQAEQRLLNLGYTWQWQVDDSLRVTTPRLQAVRDLGNGRKSFFNQLIAAYCGWKDGRNDPAKSITFGDGSPLESDGVQGAIELAEHLTVDLEWQQGDVALLDNFAVMHGRKPFTGTRKVLASLAEHESRRECENA